MGSNGPGRGGKEGRTKKQLDDVDEDVDEDEDEDM